nr:hypothetical protein [Tanacetum cinerariifolium]
EREENQEVEFDWTSSEDDSWYFLGCSKLRRLEIQILEYYHGKCCHRWLDNYGKNEHHQQAANLSTYSTKPSRRFNSFCYDDDDYEESTIPLNKIISQIPSSIVITTSPPILPIEDFEDSLIVENEKLSTILEKETDETIKSSVEDFVLIPSEFEDTSGSDITPLFDANEDECFDPGDDVDEIELLLHHDPSTPKMSVVSILEGFTNEPPLEENGDLFDLESKENEWKKILYDAPIDDLMTEDKVFDPKILNKKFSPTYVSLPFKDRHYLIFIYVI